MKSYLNVLCIGYSSLRNTYFYCIRCILLLQKNNICWSILPDAQLVLWQCLEIILWRWRDSGSGVQVLQNKNLHDLVEVLNGGTIQVLLVVVERVPHGGEGRRDEVEDPNAWHITGTEWGSPTEQQHNVSSQMWWLCRWCVYLCLGMVCDHRGCDWQIDQARSSARC